MPRFALPGRGGCCRAIRIRDDAVGFGGSAHRQQRDAGFANTAVLGAVPAMTRDAGRPIARPVSHSMKLTPTTWGLLNERHPMLDAAGELASLHAARLAHEPGALHRIDAHRLRLARPIDHYISLATADRGRRRESEHRARWCGARPALHLVRNHLHPRPRPDRSGAPLRRDACSSAIRQPRRSALRPHRRTLRRPDYLPLAMHHDSVGIQMASHRRPRS